MKHYLNWSDLISIRARARAVMQPDPHTKDGKYLIRSLYFDSPEDVSYAEKVLQSGKEKGYLEAYRYHVYAENGGKTVVFLNAAREQEQIRTLLL